MYYSQFFRNWSQTIPPGCFALWTLARFGLRPTDSWPPFSDFETCCQHVVSERQNVRTTKTGDSEKRVFQQRRTPVLRNICLWLSLKKSRFCSVEKLTCRRLGSSSSSKWSVAILLNQLDHHWNRSNIYEHEPLVLPWSVFIRFALSARCRHGHFEWKKNITARRSAPIASKFWTFIIPITSVNGDEPVRGAEGQLPIPDLKTGLANILFCSTGNDPECLTRWHEISRHRSSGHRLLSTSAWQRDSQFCVSHAEVG